jgi:hypothetical protein
MGYDGWCGTKEFSMSYNWSFYWYKYVSEERGFRYLYGKQGRDTVPMIQYLLEQLQGSPVWCINYENDGSNDGWRPTIGNAYHHAHRMLEIAKDNTGVWHGD